MKSVETEFEKKKYVMNLHDKLSDLPEFSVYKDDAEIQSRFDLPEFSVLYYY